MSPLPDEDLVEIPLIDSWARIAELETELAEARQRAEDLARSQEPLWRQIGRLRAACEAALEDLDSGYDRPLTVPRLLEALE